MWRKRLLFVCLLFLLGFVIWPLFLAPQEDVSVAMTDPQSEAALPAHAMLPKLVTKKFENGLTLYLYPLPKFSLLSVRLVTFAGSASDPPHNQGLAALTARAKSRLVSAEKREALGMQQTLSVWVDAITISLDGLSLHKDQMIDFIENVVKTPLSVETIQEEKTVLLEENLAALSSSEELADRAARYALFGEHAYGHAIFGSFDSVEALSPEDVQSFADTYYVPNNMALIVVGDIDPEEFAQSISTRLSMWSVGKQSSEPTAISSKLSVRKLLLVDLPTETVSLRIAAPTLLASHPDSPAFDLLNELLGGGFSSYLLDELRVNRGLVYDVKSTVESYRHGAWLWVSTEVARENARETLDAMLASIEKYRASGPSPERVSGASRVLQHRWHLNFEDPRVLADTFAAVLANGSGIGAIAEYPVLLKQLTLASLQKVAQQFLPTTRNDIVIVVVGDAAALEKSLQGIATIEKVEPTFFEKLP